MNKLLIAALIACAAPMAASASSINLSSAFVSVNKDMGIGASSLSGGSGSATPAAQPADCFGSACGTPIGCNTSPENPTALLAVLGAAGLLMGRIGYARLARRPAATMTAAA